MITAQKRRYNREYRLKNKIRIAAQKRKRYCEESAFRKQCNRLSNQYRRRNKEKIAEIQKEYQKRNKEKLATYNHGYFQNHRDKFSEYGKRWYGKNKDKRREKIREYDRKRATYRREFNQSFEGKYIALKRNHRKRWKEEEVMTFESFKEIALMPCNYCGDIAKKGIDRVDNAKGYIKENSVSCCKTCNYMKQKMTKEEFINHIKKIYKNLCL